VSLIRKIINNKNENLDKYGSINPDNYKMFITDMIGARILIRSKTEWKMIHDQLSEIFDASPRTKICKVSDYVTLYTDDSESVYFAEEPTAYIVSNVEQSLYREGGRDLIKTKRSDRGYRSIHYIIKYMNYYVEIQVRTIFEEGWSECDHDLVYKTPAGRKKEILRKTSNILSELAHQADELIDFMCMMYEQQPNNCNYPYSDCYANEKGE
jgi:ppGpp synthetase/RelA/SpoT-type nucleotidyltranferase